MGLCEVYAYIKYVIANLFWLNNDILRQCNLNKLLHVQNTKVTAKFRPIKG